MNKVDIVKKKVVVDNRCSKPLLCRNFQLSLSINSHWSIITTLCMVARNIERLEGRLMFIRVA